MRSTGLLRRMTGGRKHLATRIIEAAAARGDKPPTVIQAFAARRPVVLALWASTPIGIIMALAARSYVATARGALFVLANWVLVACVFALSAYAERSRQRRTGSHRGERP
ncbi:hypothetical protein ACIQZB_28925 [Streptomyces sp. NPDC097727]|uniref:hypothetical protein n=1 Tax=Streptomyces sp. NPDC097727 TaxID=3366092 RepID=UPI00382BD4D9